MPKLLYMLLLTLGLAQSLPPFPPPGVRWITLETFLERTAEASLQVLAASVNFRPADWDYYQAQANFLPSLQANANLSQNYGTTFDPFAFSRVQQTTTFGGASLSANLTLFNGFANHYLLRQTKYARLLTHATYRRIQSEVLAQALIQFFQTLTDSITIELQKQRIERLLAQIQRLSAQVETGQTLSLDLLSLEAQKAREEAQYITLYNRHRENKLNLLFLMRWENLSPDSVEFTLGLSVPEKIFTHDEVIEVALRYAPELEEARFRTLVQTYALKAARSGYAPTLSLSASMQTNYSSNAGDIRFDPQTFQLIREPYPFRRQVRENFNQSISVGFFFPIFQNFRRRAQVVRAEANLASAQINELQQRQAVLRRIESAYLSWESAQAAYAAAQRSFAAAERAYLQAQAQYEVGRLSYWAYREALLSYTQAQIDLAQAHLDLKLRTLLLLAYTGYYQNL
jgi:outer membrane protein